MAGLFTSKGVIPTEHLFKHIAVADVSLHCFDPHILKRQDQAKIAHNRNNEGVMAELAFAFIRPGEYAHDLVAVHHGTVFIYCKASVSITIKRNAHLGAGCPDHSLELLGVGGTGMVVDIIAVRRGVDDHNISTSTAQSFRSHYGCSAIGTVGNDAQPAQRLGPGAAFIRRSNSIHKMVDIHIGGCRYIMRDPAYTRAGGTLPVRAHNAFDLILFSIREFEAAARKKLDAVVRHRVMGRGYHCTHFHV